MLVYEGYSTQTLAASLHDQDRDGEIHNTYLWAKMTTRRKRTTTLTRKAHTSAMAPSEDVVDAQWKVTGIQRFHPKKARNLWMTDLLAPMTDVVTLLAGSPSLLAPWANVSDFLDECSTVKWVSRTEAALEFLAHWHHKISFPAPRLI